MAGDPWDQVVGAWRAVATAEGFRVLDGGETGDDQQRNVVEFLFDGKATYLDLTGTIRSGKRAQVRGAALHTWVERDGGRVDVATLALCQKGPEAYHPAALFSHYVLRPVLAKLLPAPLQPQRLRRPADLAGLIGQHRALLEREGGTQVLPEGDPLRARFEMTQPEEARAPDAHPRLPS